MEETIVFNNPKLITMKAYVLTGPFSNYTVYIYDDLEFFCFNMNTFDSSPYSHASLTIEIVGCKNLKLFQLQFVGTWTFQTLNVDINQLLACPSLELFWVELNQNAPRLAKPMVQPPRFFLNH